MKVLFPFIKDGGDGNAIANMMSKTLFTIAKVKGRDEGERESNSTEIVEKTEMCARGRIVLEICREPKRGQGGGR
jgi:hypothetical protein